MFTQTPTLSEKPSKYINRTVQWEQQFNVQQFNGLAGVVPSRKTEEEVYIQIDASFLVSVFFFSFFFSLLLFLVFFPHYVAVCYLCTGSSPLFGKLSCWMGGNMSLSHHDWFLKDNPVYLLISG